MPLKRWLWNREAWPPHSRSCQSERRGNGLLSSSGGDLPHPQWASNQVEETQSTLGEISYSDGGDMALRRQGPFMYLLTY